MSLTRQASVNTRQQFDEELAAILARLRIALMYGNREEADAALDKFFGHKLALEVDDSTPLAEAGIPPRTVTVLESASITTVGELCECSPAYLRMLRQCGE